jgi:NADPH:quinone reductase
VKRLETMKTVVNNPGGPAITAVDDPRPGSGEALVAVRAFSVNRGELDLLQTRTSRWRPGQDVAGVVVAQAADGSGPAADTRGVALAEQAGWSELAAVPTSRLAPLPAEVGIEQAAALPLAGLTACARYGSPATCSAAASWSPAPMAGWAGATALPPPGHRRPARHA